MNPGPTEDGRPPAADVARWFAGEPRHIHLIGLGGTGISALALILLELGHRVSGSDQRSSPVLERLRELGATAHVGHDPAHVGSAEIVICSTAIKADHPERAAAAEAGVPVLSRAEALAGLTRLRPSIAVSGTHGKTTSTAMLTLALRAAGVSVSWLIGSTVPALGVAASWGDGEWFVVEADESDDTHLALASSAALLTNAEGEHLDFHATLGRVIDGYVEFLEGAGAPEATELLDGGQGQPTGGSPVRLAGADDHGSALVAAAVPGVVTFGTAAAADWRLEMLTRSVTGTTSKLISPDGDEIALSLSVPGDHNAINAAGVVALAGELGFDPHRAALGVAAFTGTGRRFESRGSTGGVSFIDDYAHHPTEVAATLAAASGWEGGRLVAVFQPHLYSRTQRLADRFGEALASADVVVVTDVFAAREEPIPGVDGTLISDAARHHGAPNVIDAPVRAGLADAIAALIRPGDLVLTMGAGDITTLADELGAQLAPPTLAGAGTPAPGLPGDRPGSEQDDLGDLHDLGAVAVELAERLGERVRFDTDATRASWYRVGGPVTAWVDAHTVDDLLAVAASLDGRSVPITVVGEGSNLLIADAGYDGLVVHLARDGEFGDVTFDDSGVTVGGATRMPDLARRCADAGHGGLSWMAGIPGSVGGAVRMNAGVQADELELRHSLEWAEVIDLTTGEVARRSRGWFEFGYRHSRVAAGQVVTAARFVTRPGQHDDIAAENAEHLRHRKDTQETIRTAGSVWTNPPGTSAWRVIEDAGAGGLRVGTAQVSTKHANFIVADPGGSADDVRALMSEVRRMVHHHSGLVLEAETVMIGFPPFEELQ